MDTVRFGEVISRQYMQQPSEAAAACVPHDSPTLSMIWAFEDSQHMKLSEDILNLADVPNLKRTSKRRSLANLRRERAVSTARLEEQTSGVIHVGNEVDVDGKRLKNERSFRRARMLAGQMSSMKECAKPTLPLSVASTKCGLSLMPEHHEAKGAQLAKIGCGASQQETKTIYFRFLAGAAALGLRSRRCGAASEPHAQQQACFNLSASRREHLTNNHVKEKVCADGTSTMVRLEQKLREAMPVPRAPCQPQSESYRKRPQIRGVPILVIPKS